MEEYINNYDNFKKTLIFNFAMCNGGIGDCVKFFMYPLIFCMKNNIKIYYKINNIPIEKYLKLKYPQLYTNTDLNNCTQIVELKNMCTMDDDIIYYCKPSLFWNRSNQDIGSCPKGLYEYTMPIQEVFDFSDQVINNSHKLLPNSISDYISIHLRLGDKYLEMDQKFNYAPHDVRKYNEEKIFNFIKKTQIKQLCFFVTIMLTN